jgi:hypothetical protein
MYEDHDYQINQLIDELEKDAKEYDALNFELKTHFEWLDIITELNEVYNKFISNMDSLSSVYDAISVETDNVFLIGILWSGVLSAYEGFVHDFFDLLLSKQIHAEEATKKSSSLEKNISNQIRIKNNKSTSPEILRDLFRKATLNDPTKVAKLANQLFKTNIPLIDEETVARALNIRNAFTHNNGGVVVSQSDLEQFHKKIYDLVSYFIDEILSQAEKIYIVKRNCGI